jgi:hypothetical protein
MRVVTTFALSSSRGVLRIMDVTQKATILNRPISFLIFGAKCFFLSSSQYTPNSSDVCESCELAIYKKKKKKKKKKKPKTKKGREVARACFQINNKEIKK